MGDDSRKKLDESEARCVTLEQELNDEKRLVKRLQIRCKELKKALEARGGAAGLEETGLTPEIQRREVADSTPEIHALQEQLLKLRDDSDKRSRELEDVIARQQAELTSLKALLQVDTAATSADSIESLKKKNLLLMHQVDAAKRKRAAASDMMCLFAVVKKVSSCAREIEYAKERAANMRRRSSVTTSHHRLLATIAPEQQAAITNEIQKVAQLESIVEDVVTSELSRQRDAQREKIAAKKAQREAKKQKAAQG